MKPGERAPRERGESVRKALIGVLSGRSLSAKEISSELGIREREVAEHLEHLGRSVVAAGGKLTVEPARCASCGFELRSDRMRRPSRCPECKSERLTAPRFRVEPAAPRAT